VFVAAAGDELGSVGEAFGAVSKLLDEALTPGAKVGLRGEVMLLEWVAVDVEQEFLAGLALPDVLVAIVDQGVPAAGPLLLGRRGFVLRRSKR